MEQNEISIWGKSKDLIKDKLDPEIYAAWIKPLSLAKCSAVVQKPKRNSSKPSIRYNIIAPNKFCSDHVEKNYSSLISSALKSTLDRDDFELSYKATSKINNALRRKIATSEKSTKPNLKRCDVDIVNKVEIIRQAQDAVPSSSANRKTSNSQASFGSNLNDNYNFSNYVIGSCNQFAHAVSIQVAKNLGATYNPLFIYGGVGLGKTHLANAIGNYSKRTNKKVLFVSSEVFVNELISSIKSNSMEQFKARFRSMHLLIIDDIQFLSGKERTQEEFFHTFNELYSNRKQIVITSDKLPQELTDLEERLRTRFASGISVDLQVPDFETRVAILTQKASAISMNMPNEVFEFIAQKIDTNVRELEGALNRLSAFSSMEGEEISLSLAQKALSALITCSGGTDINMTSIQEKVAKRFSVSKGDLLGKRRTQNIALARQVAMYLSRKILGCSYPEIGALFGGRDHSTVIHACKSIEEKISKDSSLKTLIYGIEKGFLNLSTNQNTKYLHIYGYPTSTLHNPL